MALTQLTDRDFTKLTGVVYDLTGVTVDDSKRSMLSSRIRRRLRALELDTFSEYITKLSNGELSADETLQFIDTVTTHKTSFFRTPSVWKFLREEFAKEEYEGRYLDVWSAASSTGQEPYSLAMMLRAIRGGLSAEAKWRVTASDVSQLTVDKAAEGRYERKDVHGANAEQPKLDVLRNFDVDGDVATVKKELKDGVKFRTHNLLDPMRGSFDAVLVRNVIIYFSESDTQKVVEQATDAVKPGGLLVIGESESLIARGGRLEYEAPCIYRKKK